MPSDGFVWQAVRSIPAGEVRTYGEVAEMIGGHRSTHSQMVGQAMRRAPDSVPWWRVVRSDGSLRTPNDPGQRRRLEAEGVELTRDGRVVGVGTHSRPLAGRPTSKSRGQAPPQGADTLAEEIGELRSSMPEYAAELGLALSHQHDSPATSGAILRRALERELRRLPGAPKGADLYTLIQHFRGRLPGRVVSHAHMVRSMGNVATHAADGGGSPTFHDIDVALRSAIAVGRYLAIGR